MLFSFVKKVFIEFWKANGRWSFVEWKPYVVLNFSQRARLQNVVSNHQLNAQFEDNYIFCYVIKEMVNTQLCVHWVMDALGRLLSTQETKVTNSLIICIPIISRCDQWRRHYVIMTCCLYSHSLSFQSQTTLSVIILKLIDLRTERRYVSCSYCAIRPND
jgi:hypothetical protein